MIEVNIIGQLGNQMFEYACARQLQEIYGGRIVLNTYEMNKNMPDFKLGLLDYKLNLDVKVENSRPLKRVDADNISVKVLRKYIPNMYFDYMKKRGVFIWKSAEIYKELPRLADNQSDDIVLSGYWQCDKYFKNIEEIIKKEFQPKHKLLEHNYELFEMIKNTNSVCVTIRRGDFLSDKNKEKFYVCDIEYFQKAIYMIKKLIPDCVFFAFSDDIEWVKENITFKGKVYYECGTDPVWEKLRLMSSCKHFIISNSSFSWWAQYLSENNEKIVIAPDRWYNKTKVPKCDIYQENWKLVHIGRK